MTVNDVAELLFAARARIDFYWNFYAVVVIAITGWLVSVKGTLTTSRRVLVTVVFVLAAAMNLTGLFSAYTFAEALRTDLLRVPAASQLGATRQLLEQHSYLSHRLAACWIHLGVGVTILSVIWLARRAGPEGPARSPAAGAAPGARQG